VAVSTSFAKPQSVWKGEFSFSASIVLALLYNRAQAFSDLHVSDLASLAITSGIRLLVIFPQISSFFKI
jgi:hypothetical protein